MASCHTRSALGLSPGRLGLSSFGPLWVAVTCLAACGDPFAVQQLDERCQKEEVRACFQLAKVLATGVLGVQDDARAIVARQKALRIGTKKCEQLDLAACHTLGARYYTGTPDGLKADNARAKRFLTKACRGGEQRSCIVLRQIRKQGN